MANRARLRHRMTHLSVMTHCLARTSTSLLSNSAIRSRPRLHDGACAKLVLLPQTEHRQQCRSKRANPNERVNDVTSRPAAICSWLSVLCIESSRSCRLAAGMHSTSFVLVKGVGCVRSVFCVFVSNSNRLSARVWCLLCLLQQTPYRCLHCQFLPLVCFVDRRDKEAAGKI